MIVLLLILVLLAVTGTLAFVLKVALGVALGLILAVAISGFLVAWRLRRMVFGPRSRWRRVGRSSHIEVLDTRRRPQDF
jgi:ABC-type nickel/cobalt efflux system permease component RcnA